MLANTSLAFNKPQCLSIHLACLANGGSATDRTAYCGVGNSECSRIVRHPCIRTRQPDACTLHLNDCGSELYLHNTCECRAGNQHDGYTISRVGTGCGYSSMPPHLSLDFRLTNIVLPRAFSPPDGDAWHRSTCGYGVLCQTVSSGVTGAGGRLWLERV